MKLADLYIDVDVKGDKETGKRLEKTNNWLKDIKDSAVGAVGAVRGALGWLNNFAADSLSAGMALQQFANLTGLSTEELQKWRYWAQQSGVSADAMDASIKNIQRSMAQLKLHGNVPEGFRVIAEAEGITDQDVNDPYEILRKIRHYALTHNRNAAEKAVTDRLLSGAIGNEQVEGALLSSHFDPNSTPRGQMFSKDQERTLASLSVRLQNLITHWQHRQGFTVAKFGPEVMTDIEKAAAGFEHLADALARVAKEYHVIGHLASFVKELGEGVDVLASLANPVAANQNGLLPSSESLSSFARDILAPFMGTPPAATPTSGDTNLNMQNHFHGVVNPQEVPDHLNKNGRPCLQSPHWKGTGKLTMSANNIFANTVSAATGIASLLVVSPQSVIGYQPNVAPVNGIPQPQPPAFLFNYEGENTATLESDITDHWIEDNTTIQDQVALKPIMITAQGFIGELNNILPLPTGAAGQILSTAINTLTPLAQYAPGLSVAAQNAFNEAFFAYQVAAAAAANAISAYSTLTGQGGESVIGENGLASQPNQNKQQQAFQQFYAYWQSRTLFTVQTPWAVFTNMIIRTLKVTQSAETNTISDFEIGFKQLKFANQLQPSSATAAGGRLAIQGAAQTAQGVSVLTPSALPVSSLTGGAAQQGF